MATTVKPPSNTTAGIPRDDSHPPTPLRMLHRHLHHGTAHPTEGAQGVDTPQELGRFSWKAPARMTVGDAYDIDAYLDRLRDPARDGMSDTSTIKTSPKMTVVLTTEPAGAIDFQPDGDNDDRVLDDGQTYWHWTATPKKSGTITLMVSVFRFLPSDAGFGESPVLSAKRVVSVDVAPKAPTSLEDRLKPSLDKVVGDTTDAVGKWIGAGVVAGLVLLGSKLRPKKKEAKAADAEPPSAAEPKPPEVPKA